MPGVHKIFRGQKLISFCVLLIITIPCFAFDNYNFQQTLRSAGIVLQTASIGIGLCLFLNSLFKLKRYGESRSFMSQQMTLARPLAMLIAGVALMSLPTMVSTALLLIFGTPNIIQYNSIGPDSKAVGSIVALVRVIGVMGFMRGILLLSRVGGESSQPGTAGKAMLHIIGGVMCIQIIGVYQLFSWIFY